MLNLNGQSLVTGEQCCQCMFSVRYESHLRGESQTTSEQAYMGRRVEFKLEDLVFIKLWRNRQQEAPEVSDESMKGKGDANVEHTLNIEA